ncbi:MAG: MFS transporter [Hyphomicrobiales bacterium]|nr:MFS transporter [Hyphomicrobiales bacterium]
MGDLNQAAMQSASAKIARRLIPFLIVCYFISYLDRVNLGFAALTFRQDLSITAEVFGLGAGIFFLGYFIFEVPSNLLLEKVGARIWIARIMITWGIISAAMALVQGPNSFYFVRFLLGVAEAGFFPGIILYLTYWYTAAERAKVVGMFMVAVPLSSAIGAPLSSWILGAFTGVGGLASWQWLFIIEAAPALVFGVVVWFFLDDGPAEAEWLSTDEKQAVIAHLAGERQSREAIRKFTLGEALSHPRVIGLALVYFGVVTGLYGFGFWAPQIVKAFGLTIAQTGWVAAIPFVAGALVMIPWTKHSDATRERTWHVALPAFLGGLGLIIGAYMQNPYVSMFFLTLGSVGTFAALPTFWTLPTALLTGTAAAGGIALINAIGNVGGFVGPYLVGWIKDNALAMKIVSDQAGANALAIASIGAFMIAAGVLTLVLGHDPALEAGAHRQQA